MRFSVLLATCLIGCYGSFNEQSGGDHGKADFAYASTYTGDDKVDHPMLRGASVLVRVRLHSEVQTATIKVSTDKPDILFVETWGKGTAPGEWTTRITGTAVGSAKLQVRDAATDKEIDTVTINVGEPAKIEAPGDVGLSVGERKKFEAHVKDANGTELYVGSALEWTMDADVARFEYFYQPQGLTHGSGTAVTLRGSRPGPTTLHGQIGKVRVDIPINVNK